MYVGVDAVHVVEILEAFDEPHHRGCLIDREIDLGLGHHRHFRAADKRVGGLERWTPRWVVSMGMLASRARSMAIRRRAFPAGSGPPSRAEMVISRPNLVNNWPRLTSLAPFARLIWAHLLCPDTGQLASLAQTRG